MRHILKMEDSIIIATEDKIREIITDELDLFSKNKIDVIKFEVIRKSEAKIKEFLNSGDVNKKTPAFELGEDQEEREEPGEIVADIEKKIIKKSRLISHDFSKRFANKGCATQIKKILENRNSAEAISIPQIAELTSFKRDQIEKPLERMIKSKSIFRIKNGDLSGFLYYGKESESKEITHEMPEEEKVNLGRPAKEDGTTIKILNFVDNLVFDKAKTTSEIMIALDLTKNQVSEPLRRLTNTDRISRRRHSGSPTSAFMYYQYNEQDNNKCVCAARGPDREILVSECVPNEDHTACIKCQHNDNKS